jgi:hypothetical protein
MLHKFSKLETSGMFGASILSKFCYKVHFLDLSEAGMFKRMSNIESHKIEDHTLATLINAGWVD